MTYPVRSKADKEERQAIWCYRKLAGMPLSMWDTCLRSSLMRVSLYGLNSPKYDPWSGYQLIAENAVVLSIANLSMRRFAPAVH